MSLISAFIFVWHSLCTCLCPNYPFYKDNSHSGWGVYLTLVWHHLKQLHLQWPWFQIGTQPIKGSYRRRIRKKTLPEVSNVSLLLLIHVWITHSLTILFATLLTLWAFSSLFQECLPFSLSPPSHSCTACWILSHCDLKRYYLLDSPGSSLWDPALDPMLDPWTPSSGHRELFRTP